MRTVDIDNLSNQLDEMDLRMRELQRSDTERERDDHDSDQDRQEEFNQYVENDQLLRQQINTLQDSVHDLEQTRYTYNEYTVTNLPQEVYHDPSLGYINPNEFQYGNFNQNCNDHSTCGD